MHDASKNVHAIFDLDGTLTATNEVDSSCFVEGVRAEFGFTPNDDWGSYEHCPDEGIALEAITAHLGAVPSAGQLERLKLRFAGLSEPIPLFGSGGLGRERRRRSRRTAARAGGAG